MKRKNTIAIVGAVHGNERVGVNVIKRLGKRVDGKYVTSLIANKEAYKNNVRFINQDLNRSFPGRAGGNYEEKLAFDINRKIKAFDYLVDLHSFSFNGSPFAILTKRSKAHFQLAEKLGIRKVVLMSPELAGGKSLIDHCSCGVSIETGKHNLKLTDKRAEKYVRNVLGGRSPKTKVTYFEVMKVFQKKGNEKLVDRIKNFQYVRKGMVIALGAGSKRKTAFGFYPVLAREKAYPETLCLAAKIVKIKERRNNG